MPARIAINMKPLRGCWKGGAFPQCAVAEPQKFRYDDAQDSVKTFPGDIDGNRLGPCAGANRNYRRRGDGPDRCASGPCNRHHHKSRQPADTQFQHI